MSGFVPSSWCSIADWPPGLDLRRLCRAMDLPDHPWVAEVSVCGRRVDGLVLSLPFARAAAERLFEAMFR